MSKRRLLLIPSGIVVVLLIAGLALTHHGNARLERASRALQSLREAQSATRDAAATEETSHEANLIPTSSRGSEGENLESGAVDTASDHDATLIAQAERPATFAYAIELLGAGPEIPKLPVADDANSEDVSVELRDAVSKHQETARVLSEAIRLRDTAGPPRDDVIAVIGLSTLLAARAHVSFQIGALDAALDELRRITQLSERMPRPRTLVEELVRMTLLDHILDRLEIWMAVLPEPTKAMRSVPTPRVRGGIANGLLQELQYIGAGSPVTPTAGTDLFATVREAIFGPLDSYAAAVVIEETLPLLHRELSDYPTLIGLAADRDRRISEAIRFLPSTRSPVFNTASFFEQEACQVSRLQMAQIAARILEAQPYSELLRDPLTGAAFVTEKLGDVTVIRSTAPEGPHWTIPVLRRNPR